MKTISIVSGILPGRGVKNATNPNLELLRKSELEVARSRYQWQKQTELPGYLLGTSFGAEDVLPREEIFSATKTKEMLANVM